MTDNKINLKEINRRIQAEKAAKEEIERLRRELNNLKSKPPPPKEIVYQPEPKPRERTPAQMLARTPIQEPIPQRNQSPVPAAPRKSKTVSQNPALDIFNKLKSSIEKCKI